MTQAEIKRAASEFVDKNSTWAEEDELRELFKLGSEASDETLKQIGDDYSKKMAAAFLAGAEHAGAKWISVKDAPPSDGATILALVYGECVIGQVDFLSTDPGEFHFSGKMFSYIDKAHRVIELWMPLPAAPEAESK